jgi:hypothetical protein
MNGEGVEGNGNEGKVVILHTMKSYGVAEDRSIHS